MSKRDEYLKTLYRVWGITKVRDKLNFWEFFQGPTGGTDLTHLPLETQLLAEEEFQCGGADPEADFWPNERKIRIQKWLWERGVTEEPRAQVRYFRHHYPELLADAPDEFADLKETLEWFYKKLIFSQ